MEVIILQSSRTPAFLHAGEIRGIDSEKIKSFEGVEV